MPFMVSCEKNDKQTNETTSILGTWELQSVILETLDGWDSEIKRNECNSFDSKYYLVFYEDKVILYVDNGTCESSYVFNSDIMKLTLKDNLEKRIPNSAFGLQEGTYEVFSLTSKELKFGGDVFYSDNGWPCYRDTFCFKKKKAQ